MPVQLIPKNPQLEVGREWEQTDIVKILSSSKNDILSPPRLVLTAEACDIPLVVSCPFLVCSKRR